MGIGFDLQLKASDPLRRRINVSFRRPGQCKDLPLCLCDVKDKCTAYGFQKGICTEETNLPVLHNRVINIVEQQSQ